MIKKILFTFNSVFLGLILFIFVFNNNVYAVPMCPFPVEVTQADGSIITVTNYGDEFFSWTEDEDGNVIKYDEY